MTNTNIMRRNVRPKRRQDPTHLFAIGQAVQLRGRSGRPASPSDIYQITGTLPPRGGSLQYRIRNEEERHERVTTQDNLELVSKPLSGDEATLIDRTFGDGQGTEPQQSRDQKTEEEGSSEV